MGKSTEQPEASAFTWTVTDEDASRPSASSPMDDNGKSIQDQYVAGIKFQWVCGICPLQPIAGQRPSHPVLLPEHLSCSYWHLSERAPIPGLARNIPGYLLEGEEGSTGHDDACGQLRKRRIPLLSQAPSPEQHKESCLLAHITWEN